MQIQSTQYRLKNGWDVNFESSQRLDSENTLIFLFGAPEFKEDTEVFKKIKQAWPKSTIVGCSSSGEIFADRICDQSLSLAVAKFEHSKFKAITLPITNASKSYEIGKDIAAQLNQKDLVSVFILSDGLAINGTDLVNGINSIIPDKVVTGGLAGDGTRFQKTWVLKDSVPQSGYVVAVGIYGQKVRVGHGSQGGWDIFGPERLVTRSQENILFELDGEPALMLYKKYLGDKAVELPASGLYFPLQIRASEKDDKRIIRTVLGVDEATQSLKFAGSIPQGSLAQLMRANFDRLVGGALEAAKLIQLSPTKSPVLSLAVSCVGRRVVLGERTEEEVEGIKGIFPKNTHQVGFYSYGEICPFLKGRSTELHNQTMTITTICEDEG